MQHTLRTLGWLACVFYSTIPSFWLLIHPRAEYWRGRPRSPYRVLIPAWVGMWLVVGVLSAPWRHIVLYKTAWGWLPAAFSFAAGISLYRKSSANFSPKQLSGLAELRTAHPEQNLVTTGIRGRVRHPVYLAHLCEMLAWSIGTGLAACYTLTLFTIVTGALMIRMEDNELEQRFGDSYRAYKNSVPAFFPRLT